MSYGPNQPMRTGATSRNGQSGDYYEGPGNGSTHVPFGYRVAAMVKSPAVPPLVNCFTEGRVSVPQRQCPTRNTHREPEEVYDPGLQRCQGVVQCSTNEPLDIIDQKGEAVPALVGRERIPEDDLVLKRDRSIVTRRVRQELGQV